jgi:hypothetical protein
VDAIDPRTGNRFAVEVLRGWTFNLADETLSMSARVRSDIDVTSVFVILDGQSMREDWATATAVHGSNVWRRTAF